MPNTVRNMHYDYKQKLNKIDSSQNRNLKVPEIDWKLNEAMNIFIKMIAEPKYSPYGFESSQRSIDSIRPIVVENKELTLSKLSDKVFSAALPDDYMIHLSSYGVCKKGTCSANIRTNIIQHDDKETEFHISNFEWRELNIMFAGNTIQVLTDETFTVDKVYLSYVRMPKYIHTAVDFVGGQYLMPDGETQLTGYQNCELPIDVHNEVVDLAVLITTGDLLSNYQVKQTKTQMTN